MARLPILVGAVLVLAVPAFAASTVTTTTTTITQSVAPSWIAPPPAVVIVSPPETVIVPPVINSGDSGVAGSDIGVGSSAPLTTDIWREYYRGPDGLMHERTTTRSHAP
jgi:hypothetical protein